jgi:hypothetical protein
MRMKCSARMCQWDATWTCRVCDEPRCIYHSKSIGDTRCDCGNHANLLPREERAAKAIAGLDSRWYLKTS